MIYELVKFDNPILYKEAEKFDFDNPPIDPLELYQNMKDTMLHLGGYGLTCCQVGLPYSMFVFGTSENVTGVFNPKIVSDVGEEKTLDEGCLTFPGLVFNIKRSDRVRVRFQTYNGALGTQEYRGLTARIFQHEMEHIKGNPFFGDVSRLKLEMAIKKASKRGYNYTIKDLLNAKR